jgi:hypothetical protein
MPVRAVAFAFALLSSSAIAVQAATLGYENVSGEARYGSSNLGGASGSAPVTIVSGQVTGSVDSGELTVSGTGGRVFGGEADASVLAALGPDGFAFDLRVNATARCLANPSAGSCPPSILADAELEFDFVPDTDMEVAFSGNWVGSDGGGLSLVDFFGLSIERETGNPFNPQTILSIDTNRSGFTDEAGSVDTALLLLAGNRYTLSVGNQTSATASNADLVVADSGFARFSLGTAPAIPLPPTFLLIVAAGSALGVAGARRRHGAS